MTRVLFLSFLLFTLLQSSCKKGDLINGPNTVSGSARVDIQVVHHTYGVGNCRIFVKRNTQTFPGTDTTIYETKATCDKNGFMIFENLTNGNYCFYAKGFDVMVADSVWGYNFLTIDNKPGENKDYNLLVPVSE